MMEIKLSEDKLNLSKAENDHSGRFLLNHYKLWSLYPLVTPKIPGNFSNEFKRLEKKQKGEIPCESNFFSYQPFYLPRLL